MNSERDTKQLPALTCVTIDGVRKKGPERYKHRGLTVTGLRRWILYEPLAILLVIMLLPVFSWLDTKAGPAPHPFQAAAQASYCNPTPSNAVLRVDCPAGQLGNTFGDLYQLETDAVNAYLAEHKLPATDAHVIYDYGRSDLRDEIRANMLAIILGIANKPSSQWTAHETNLYAWLQSLVQQNEIALYTNAQNEYNRWQNDPCTYALDSTIASTYGLSYDGAPFCFANISTLFGGPVVPAASYYQAYGMKTSYGASATQFPYFSTLVAGTSVGVGEIAGIATAGGAVIAAAASVPLLLSLTAAFDAFEYITAVAAASIQATGLAGFGAAASDAFVMSGAAVAEAGGVAAAAAGPAAIVFIGVAIGIDALMSLLNDNNNHTAIANMLANLPLVKQNPPNLGSFANDSSGIGMYKLQTTLDAQTVPEVASTAALPTHQAGDLSFDIQPSSGGVSGTLTYQDWNGVNWSAKTWGGWFVQTCTSPAASCVQADSITASLRYVDWSGVNWTASRAGNNFISTKASPASTDVPCAADTITGLTPPGTNLSTCASYVSTSIPLTDANGNHVMVALSPLSPPVITSAATVGFSPGTASTQTVTAVGSPTPTICLVSGSLTSDFTLNGGQSCATGSFPLVFNGDAKAANQTYKLTFTASNGIGTALTQAVSVDVNTVLSIISPSSFTGTAGLPVSFTVVAIGDPTPTLSAATENLLGLNFHDNGNGTATISGVVPFAESNACLNGSGITASNSQGTVSQCLVISITNPPPAKLLPPTSATFLVGVANRVQLNSGGSITGVSWGFVPDPSAPWLTFHDNGNGTALLLGTPPLGTSGTFNPKLSPAATGSVGVLDQPFPVTVENVPAFISLNSTEFTVGGESFSVVAVNQGTVSLQSTLPAGLSFTPGTPAFISGSPATGTGGQYNIVLKDDAGTLGSVTQNLTLEIDEGPKFTSTDEATFFTGLPASFTITTRGFPSLSATALPPNPVPPTSISQGEGMYFTVSGLPADLHFSNLNPQGFATGTLTISGTPSKGDAGVHQVQITAQNGVGQTATQNFTLRILQITGPAPASGTTCNGNYDGTFHGDVHVLAGQNCLFVNGGVDGNVSVTGGNLVLQEAKVTGNAAISGSSTFSILPGTQIQGNLNIRDIASETTTNQVCGIKLGGNAAVSSNASPIQIGSSDGSCLGNSVSGNFSIANNTAPTQVYNNTVDKNLSCSGNTSITGGGDSAGTKKGQCAAF